MDCCEGGGEDDDVVDLRVGTSRRIRVFSAKVMVLNPRGRHIGPKLRTKEWRASRCK